MPTPFWKSKTFWGLAIAAVATAAQHVAEAAGAAQVAQYIGFVLALYGRITATGPLSLS